MEETRGAKERRDKAGGIRRREDNEERGEDSTIKERIGEERENIVLVERVVVLDCSRSHGLCSKNDWRQYCFSY